MGDSNHIPMRRVRLTFPEYFGGGLHETFLLFHCMDGAQLIGPGERFIFIRRRRAQDFDRGAAALPLGFVRLGINSGYLSFEPPERSRR
jgi:hypothetical protein